MGDRDRGGDEGRPHQDKEDWRRTIYCGGMRYETEEGVIREFFTAEYGPVTSVKIITDRETGNSKGFSFVTFSDERDAEKALLTGTGKLLDGAPIKINVARSQMPPRGAGGPFERGRGRGRGGFFPPRPAYRDGPFRGRDFSPDNDRYSPPPRGRSRSPRGGDDVRKRRRHSASRSRSPPRRSRSFSPPPGPRGRSRSPAGRPSSGGGGFREHGGGRAPGSTPAGPALAGGGELGQLRQSEAEAAARLRKVEGELERQRIMAHELEAEAEGMHAEAKARDASLRRHRELLSSLHAGVGRLVAARQELRAAEDGLAGLYAESATFLERSAEERGGRRRASDAAAAPPPAPASAAAANGGRREGGAAAARDTDAQLQRAMLTAVRDEGEEEEGGWRDAKDAPAAGRFRGA